MTQNHFYYLSYIFFLFLVETAARKVLEQNSFFVPMLVLLVCLAAALKFSVQRTIWFCFFAGFLLEIFSGRFFGSYIFALEFTALSILLITRKVITRDAAGLNIVFLAILGTLFFVLGIFIYESLFALLGFGTGPSWKSFFRSKLLWTIAVNLIAFFPVKFFFNILSKRSEKSI